MRSKAMFDHVIAKLRSSAGRITRIITTRDNPYISSIRQLCLSYLRSILAYALPLWSPTVGQMSKLNTVVANVLRRALRLPDSVSVSAVFAQMNWPDTPTLREYSCLLYGRRLS